MQGRRSKEKPKCYYQRQLFILSEHTDGLSPAKSLCQIDAPNSAPLFTHIFKSILNPGYDRTTPFRFIPDTIPMPLWVFGQHFCWDNIWPNQYMLNQTFSFLFAHLNCVVFFTDQNKGDENFRFSCLSQQSYNFTNSNLLYSSLRSGRIKRRWFNIDCAAVSIALFGPVFVRCLTW